MPITTFDKAVEGLTAGESRAFLKQAFTAEGAGTWHSMWKVPGYPYTSTSPATGVGAIPTDATEGSFPFTNAAGAANNYLGYMAASSATACTLIVYDRLWHNSGLSGTSVASQTINSTALTRYTTGDGVEIWGEIYTPIGATAATLTVTYTDQGNTGSNSATYAHPANAESTGQMFPLTMAVGDYGCRSIQSAIWSISTGTAGDFGLVLLKRLLTIPLQTPNVAAVVDILSAGKEIADDACLAFMVLCSTTAQGQINGDFHIAKA